MTAARLAELVKQLGDGQPVMPPRLTRVAAAVRYEFQKMDQRKQYQKHVANMAPRGQGEKASFWRRLALAAKRAFMVA